jgi:hypothetical protein
MGTIAIKFEFSRCLWKTGYKKKKTHQLQTRKQKKGLKMHLLLVSFCSIKHNIMKIYGGDEASVPIFLTLALDRDDMYISAVSHQSDWQQKEPKHCKI